MIHTLVVAPSASTPVRLMDAEAEYCSGWWIHTLGQVDSTNTVAASLPAWNAVRAATQTAGRGRTGRPWVSDHGGLWLSAVLPCAVGQRWWQFLPLAVGWGLARSLQQMGVVGLRLRWPNDLMVGRRKLAGLLVERFSPDTIVVGLGINIVNTPERSDPQLFGTTVRLADLVDEIRTMEQLTVDLLSGLRLGHATLESGGFPAIAADLNARWTESGRVELTLAAGNPPVRGLFAGIDERGALRLTNDDGVESAYDAAQVALLRELD